MALCGWVSTVGVGEGAACSVQWKAWQRTLVRTCAFAWEPAQHVLGAFGPSLFRSCFGLVLGT